LQVGNLPLGGGPSDEEKMLLLEGSPVPTPVEEFVPGASREVLFPPGLIGEHSK